jgi:hypothetical protein
MESQRSVMNELHRKTRRLAAAFLLAAQAICGMVSVAYGPITAPWLVYPALACGILLSAAILVTGPGAPKRDSILFVLATLAGAVALGGWPTGLPASFPVWLWCIVGIAAATLGLLTDAEEKNPSAAKH